MTDLHLNFLEADDHGRFLESVRDDADAFVISGDISDSPQILGDLAAMRDTWRKPIYFVLGNHDYYGSSIRRTRTAVTALAEDDEWLTYLTASGVVPLSSRTALVGHDGWADARLGHFDSSPVVLNDYLAIEELDHWKTRFVLDKPALRPVLERLGDEAAAHFEVVLAEAAARYPMVIAVTHVPPFRDAAWHEGRPSDDNYLPHFSCEAVGLAMRRVMEAHPGCRLYVLCGHTHGSGEVQILPNLRVLTGGAEYGHPMIHRVFDID